MANMKSLMRKLFHKNNGGGSSHGAAMDDAEEHRSLQLRLRKAVTVGKPRQVAALLDAGASPIWMQPDGASHSMRSRNRMHRGREPELNALLLGCRRGDVQVLSLLLDAFFLEPQVLAHFSRAMYCLVIRHGHWQAFQRLQQRRVPIVASHSVEGSESHSHSNSPPSSSTFLSVASSSSSSSKLPLPIFVAAEHGRHQILSYLLRHYPRDWAHYTFDGQSLLSVASKNGHYECVQVLLSSQMVTGAALDSAIAIARRHRQAHVLVLLTSCLPEYCSDPEPVFKSFSPPMSYNYENNLLNQQEQPQLQWHTHMQMHSRQRASVAETVASEYDEENRRSSLLVSSPINYDRVEEMQGRAEQQREQQQSGMTWLMERRKDQEEMQRRDDPLGRTLDGFAILKSARDADKYGEEDTSSSSEDESWYAYKNGEEENQRHLLLLPNDAETEPIKSAAVCEREVNQWVPQSMNKFQVLPSAPIVPAPRSTPLVRSMSVGGGSRKLISVRSRNFSRHRSLAAIDEHPGGEIEA